MNSAVWCEAVLVKCSIYRDVSNAWK